MTSIIVGTDLSDNALTAAQWAFGLARLLASDDNPVHVLVTYILEPDEFNLRQAVAGNEADAERADTEQEIRRWLDDVDTDEISYEVELNIGRRADTLSALADEQDADWLVVGKSGRGRLARFFIGSTAEDLALRPPCPLALIHPDATWDEPLRILAAIDLTESSADAAELAATLASQHGGDLRLLHIISIPNAPSTLVEGPQILPQTLETHLDQTTQWATDEINALLEDRTQSFAGLSTEIDIRPGYPIHEILAAIDDDECNFVTLGSHGRSRLATFMLGGIGRSVLKRAPCNIILAPPVNKDIDDE